MREEDRIKQLKALCNEADRLQKAAAELCKNLTVQIEQSKRLLARKALPQKDRRKRPR